MSDNVSLPKDQKPRKEDDDESGGSKKLAKSLRYINTTVTENANYPTEESESIGKSALVAAQRYYDLFFPGSPTVLSPTSSFIHPYTVYHTFFPPVLEAATRKQIVETIVGGLSRPYREWAWRPASDFVHIQSTHEAFLKKIGERSDGVPVLPAIKQRHPSSNTCVAASAVLPAPKPPSTKPGSRPNSGRPASASFGSMTSSSALNPSAPVNEMSSVVYTVPASVQGPEYFSRVSEEGAATLLIVMVGLPARGKTFTAQKICRMLGWHGERATVYNLQTVWRQLMTSSQMRGGGGAAADKSDSKWISCESFERLLLEPNSAERKSYLRVLDQFATSCKEYFADGGKVVVLNDDFVTHELREEMEKRFRHLSTQFFYIETIRNAELNREYNELKVLDPMEYPNAKQKDARDDFGRRVALLERLYEPLDDVYKRKMQHNTSSSPLPASKQPFSYQMPSIPFSYATVRDCFTVDVHHIAGYLSSRIISYLMNVSQRKIQHPIYFVRHGESCYNLEDRIGGNPLLTEQGMRDSAALLEFLDSFQKELKANPLNGTTEEMELWTSQLQRAVQTAELSERLLDIRTLRWSSLNEIHAGVCEDMTYAEVRSKYSLIDRFRKENKYTFRYPGGESYQDLVVRLEPVIMELENADKPVVVVAHQAILRCLLAYFGSVSAESSIRVKVPHRVVWRCTYDSKGVARLEEIKLDNAEAGRFA